MNARIAIAMVLGLALASGVWGQSASAGGNEISKEALTKRYRLLLKIGPGEKMFSKADAAKTRPTDGEVMVGGTMTQMNMSGGMAADVRHLEVHVFMRATGKIVTNARVQITVVNESTKMTMPVPIAVMYGIKEGPADWHYGNNVSVPHGTYRIVVVANGEVATFHVTVPKM